MRPTGVLRVGFVVGALAVPAWGQEPALQGPKVVEGSRPATLVQRDMTGVLVKIEERPEVAALALLELTADERAAAEKVVQERFVQVSKAVSDHYDLFQKIQAARQGGAERGEIAPLIRQFRDAAAPLFDPPLDVRLAAALPEAKRERFRGLVDEYKKAMVAEETQKRDSGEAVSERRAMARVEINLTLRELGRALRATVQDRRERADELLKRIDATPEQEAKIRAIIREVAGKDGIVGELSDEKRREMMERILAELTPEQRRAAMQRLRRP